METDKLEHVGFWLRVGAALIDSVLVVVITFSLLFLIYGDGYLMSDELVRGPADFVISWLLPAVATITFWSVKQATPGKMAIGAKILDQRTGQAPTLRQLIGRYFSYIISALPLLLGFI